MIALPLFARLHELAKTTNWSGMCFRQDERILSWDDKYAYVGPARLEIFTLDFDIDPHCDDDKLTGERFRIHMERLRELDGSKFVNPKARSRLSNYKAFFNSFGTSCPTTCCYQHVETILARDSQSGEVKVLQVFVMLGLGLSFRVENYWNHIFHGGAVAHLTCIPMFFHEGKVYYRHHPLVVVLAWGCDSSGDSNPTA